MARLKPDQKTRTWHAVIGLGAIVFWFVSDIIFPNKPDFIYGHYGWLIMAVLASVIANYKGRNPIAWFAGGMYFVLGAVILVVILPKLYDAECPYCRKEVSVGAVVCPYCQRDIVTTDAGTPGSRLLQP